MKWKKQLPTMLRSIKCWTGISVNIAILHYAAPPVVGGVEQTIYSQRSN